MEEMNASPFYEPSQPRHQDAVTEVANAKIDHRLGGEELMNCGSVMHSSNARP